MKAPDKIYLNKFMIRPGMLRPAQFPPDESEEEYIRKDAILEWLNKQLVASAESLRFERNKAFADVIDKINSL